MIVVRGCPAVNEPRNWLAFARDFGGAICQRSRVPVQLTPRIRSVMKISRLIACGFAALLAFGVVTSSASAATCSPTGKCKACTTCSSCKNCSKNGGTCSVCRGGAKEEKVSAAEAPKADSCCDTANDKSAEKEAS